MRSLIIIFCLGFVSLTAYAQKSDSPEITIDELYDHIDFLADDSLKGREPGTPGGKAAAEYIRERIKKAGLTMLGNDGFQYFEVTKGVKAGENNSLSFDELRGKLMERLCSRLIFSK